MKSLYKYPKINMELIRELIEEYQKDKSEEIREKLILECYPLVPYIVKRYIGNPSVDDESLISYGVEGLINGIETYSSSPQKYFLTYIDNAISRAVSNGIGEFYGLGVGFIVRFNTLRKQIESYYGEKIEDNPEFLDEILEMMCYEEKISINNIEEYKNRILLRMCIDKRRLQSTNFVDTTDYMNILQRDFNNQLRFEIDKVLSKLTVTQREILLRKFGLIGDEEKRICEIAAEFGKSWPCIFDSLEKACENIKKKGQNLIEYIPYLSEEIEISSPVYSKKKKR